MCVTVVPEPEVPSPKLHKMLYGCVPPPTDAVKFVGVPAVVPVGAVIDTINALLPGPLPAPEGPGVPYPEVPLIVLAFELMFR